MITKYHKELLAFAFPVTIYDRLINSSSRKSDSLNDSFNRNIFKNTPKEYYLDNDAIIYYNSLKKVNASIEEWIEIFLFKAKISNDNIVICDYYQYVLKKIKEEIDLFAKCCETKYHLKNIITDTLIKTYLSILESRYINIKKKLYDILREEYGIYFDGKLNNDFDHELNNICDGYIKLILKDENNNVDSYMFFREEINRLIIKHNDGKKLIKNKEEKKWNLEI